MRKEWLKKHVLLVGGIALILLSALAIHDLYAPGIGPMATVSPSSLIWIVFPFFMFVGIVFIVLSIYSFLFEAEKD